MGVATGAFPLRKVTGRKRSARTVDEHIEWLKQHLYDEGPQSLETLALRLDLAECRAHEVLKLGELQGDFTQFRRDGETYWMLDETH